MNKLLLILTIIILGSCSKTNPSINKFSMEDILQHCKGHAVVITKGYNSGNFESYRYYLIIRDDSLNCYEYIGAKYEIEIGDTLK